MTSNLPRTATSLPALFLSIGLSIAACGGSGPAPVAAGPAEPSATPAPRPPVATPAPVWPLTGLPADNAAQVRRRPLNVRLPNDPLARPQFGLAKADVVFDLIVEGGVSRYSAIYQSQSSETVGPTRSYRFSDLHITQMLRGALVASGATLEEKDAITTSIRAGNMLSVDFERAPAPYYRVSFRRSPNNLFVNLDRAREALDKLGGADPVDVPPLRFLASSAHDSTAGGFVGSVPATTVTVPLQRDPPTFTWDDGSKGYRRAQAGVRTADADGGTPILARNVVVMHTNIWQTSVVEDIYGSKGLDYRMTGTGAASIFRDGRRQDGTWKREGPLDQFSFFNHAGEPIALSPGQTWIHFVYPDWVITSAP